MSYHKFVVVFLPEGLSDGFHPVQFSLLFGAHLVGVGGRDPVHCPGEEGSSHLLVHFGHVRRHEGPVLG